MNRKADSDLHFLQGVATIWITSLHSYILSTPIRKNRYCYRLGWLVSRTTQNVVMRRTCKVCARMQHCTMCMLLYLSYFSLLPTLSFHTCVANHHCEGGQLQAPTPCMNPGNFTWLSSFWSFVLFHIPFYLPFSFPGQEIRLDPGIKIIYKNDFVTCDASKMY